MESLVGGGAYGPEVRRLRSLPLPVDQAEESHCGSCRACIDICPTQAIVAPYELDARRCTMPTECENGWSPFQVGAMSLV